MRFFLHFAQFPYIFQHIIDAKHPTQIKKETFSCAVLGNVFKNADVCFTSESSGYYRYRIGTNKHNISLHSSFNYSFDNEYKKIVVIAPTPKNVLICDMNKEKRVFNAEKMWNSVAYDKDAFLGAIDRECLGKYTTTSASDNSVVLLPKLPRIPKIK